MKKLQMKVPAISSQQFRIAEHSYSRTVLGTVTASDEESDELFKHEFGHAIGIGHS